jgi:hypothetical protein
MRPETLRAGTWVLVVLLVLYLVFSVTKDYYEAREIRHQEDQSQLEQRLTTCQQTLAWNREALANITAHDYIIDTHRRCDNSSEC